MLPEFQPPELVGFVGLGQMGAPMAMNLADAGFRLAVADSDPRAVERFRAVRACEAPATLAEMGRACRVAPPGSSTSRSSTGGASSLAARVCRTSAITSSSAAVKARPPFSATETVDRDQGLPSNWPTRRPNSSCVILSPSRRARIRCPTNSSTRTRPPSQVLFRPI